jgi:hypothetical protein
MVYGLCCDLGLYAVQRGILLGSIFNILAFMVAEEDGNRRLRNIGSCLPCSSSWGGVRPSQLGTSVTNWSIVPASVDECGIFSVMSIGWGKRST